MRFLIGGISLPFTEADEAFCSVAKSKMKRAVDPAQFHFCVYRKSVDARKRNDIRFVCSVLAVTDAHLSQKTVEKLKDLGFSVAEDEFILPPKGTEPLSARPLIVGLGPAGMFCALLLAEMGYAPLVIDRGGDVRSRTEAYERFCREHILDKENNIQFGAGGAGTFSDGKLTTRINDPRCSYVLKRLCEFGAPNEILIKAKPHVGTDRLKTVVNNVIKGIERCGGEVIMNCRLERLIKNSDGSLTAKTSKGDFFVGCAVLATGHSARDTYSMLMSEGYSLEAKPFSVGVRIEHLREDIDRSTYGKFAGDPRLGAAEYNFSDTTGRGVYTFCMCPGGEVVAAATEDGGVVVNGMSCLARDGRNSNSAIAVTVRREDYGGGVENAVNYQRELERAAFAAGGGEFVAPIQTVGDFLAGCVKNEPSRILPTYMNGNNCRITDIGNILPSYITNELKKGIVAFGKRRQGFDAPDALLTGLETRTSSPVRILRRDCMASETEDLVYPCGEGAGYAGGITSAAVDGIKVASAIIERFSLPKLK